MKLYTQYRNSAGQRVRIALALKGIAYEYVSVSSIGQEAYRALNPQGLMPALDIDGRIIAQSGAILAYLEETYPAPPLLPADPLLRAQARSFALLITGEMHAITVLRVMRFLESGLTIDQAGQDKWRRHWMSEGFAALEEMLARREKDWPFCFGDAPGWADLHLAPQLANGRRFGCDLSAYKRLLAVEARCNALDAFVRARPEHQPDFPG